MGDPCISAPHKYCVLKSIFCVFESVVRVHVDLHKSKIFEQIYITKLRANKYFRNLVGTAWKLKFKLICFWYTLYVSLSKGKTVDIWNIRNLGIFG